jgi:hypothetical protein
MNVWTVRSIRFEAILALKFGNESSDIWALFTDMYRRFMVFSVNHHFFLLFGENKDFCGYIRRIRESLKRARGRSCTETSQAA